MPRIAEGLYRARRPKSGADPKQLYAVFAAGDGPAVYALDGSLGLSPDRLALGEAELAADYEHLARLQPHFERLRQSFREMGQSAPPEEQNLNRGQWWELPGAGVARLGKKPS